MGWCTRYLPRMTGPSLNPWSPPSRSSVQENSAPRETLDPIPTTRGTHVAVLVDTQVEDMKFLQSPEARTQDNFDKCLT